MCEIGAGNVLASSRKDDTPHFNGLKVSSQGLSIGSKQAEAVVEF